jgi:transposase
MKPVSAFQLAGDARRVAFLSELLHGASASLAAARADLNRGTVYRWKLADREFAALWAEIVASRPRQRHLRARVFAKSPRNRVIRCLGGRSPAAPDRQGTSMT